ncbi:MAG: Gfo/Idh/MocA family oxidoreductase [Alphaproteobacteria bacterium]|nr:Gfo/Idh/MocA family oxidoreductase [Alphaproteobacteria bacterium]
MKKVITYGTFDLLHKGHLNILKKAKELGDYLVVGITSENYDISRGKLNVSQSLIERIENVKSTGLADLIIVEDYVGQKIHDIEKYNIDTFVIGSDWDGEFDYLKPYCNVVYIERTKGVSSTELRNKNNKILNIGIVGNGRIAKRFMLESRYVSGITVNHIFGRNPEFIKDFASQYNLDDYYTDYDEFLSNVDAVYIALPHTLHYEYAKKALSKGKHVLCEKPMTLDHNQTAELYDIAEDKGLIIQEGIKTAYCPCFEKLVSIAKSGIIGDIKDVSATFTKLVEDKSLREYNKSLGGGSLNELGSYPLLIIAKLLGTNPYSVEHIAYNDEETDVDIYSKIILKYPSAVASANVGIGVKKDGCCIISGTKGYIYVPAPWWKTEYFEIRFEDLNKTKKVFTSFEGDGLRYEIADFLRAVNSCTKTYKIKKEESVFIGKILDGTI